jgi:predicted Zn-dependent peptidase
MKEFKPDKYTKKILPNGITLTHTDTKVKDIFRIELILRAGALHESKKNLGLAHLLEHLMSFYTSKTDPHALKNQQELSEKGIEVNAWTGDHTCGYYLFGLKEHQNRMIELILNNLIHPVIDKTIFPQEIKAVTSELDTIIHDTWYDLETATENVLYNNTNLKHSVLDEKNNVKNHAKIGNVMHFRKKFYIPELININITTDEKSPKVKIFSKMELYFKNCKKDNKFCIKNKKNPVMFLPYKLPKKIRGVFYVKPKHTLDIYKIQFFYNLNFTEWDDKKYTLSCIDNVLTDGLGSRLYKNLRSKLGAVYGVSSDIQLDVQHPELSYFSIETETTADKVEKVTNAIIEELEKMRTEKIGTEELKKFFSVSDLEYNLEINSYDYDKYSDHYNDSALWNKKILTFGDMHKKEKAVCKEKVIKLCNTLFNPDNRVIFYCGNKQILKDYSAKNKLKHNIFKIL